MESRWVTLKSTSQSEPTTAVITSGGDLKADYVKDDAGVYAVSGLSSTIFEGLSAITFDDGTHGIYDVRYPDCLNAYGGSAINLSYDGTSYKAGIQYQGSYKLVNLGFPFETVYPEASRDSIMSRVLSFFTVPPDVDLTPPAVVENLAATCSGTDLFLAWSPVSTDTSGLPEEFSHYILYRNTSPTTPPAPEDSLAGVTDTFYTDAGVVGNPQPFYYTVRAVDTGGNKSVDSQRVGTFGRDLHEVK